jgi:hypothetical protein
MRWFRYLPILFVNGWLMSVFFTSAQALAAQELAQAIEAPKPKEKLSPDSALNEARRLSQEGKFDEAIAQLKALAANQPDLKGLSHELGIVYYKKSDYL